MTGPVQRAVIPAAGWGTRFLPATKAVPKELLPVVDVPVIEYAVAEAVAAGITEIVIVVSDGKDAIEQHFAPAPDLEAALEAAGKDDALAAVQGSARMARIEYVVQEEQLGLGHAVMTAAEAVADGPFAVLLPDEVVSPVLLQRMLTVHAEHDAATIGLMVLPREELGAYGVPDAAPVAGFPGDLAAGEGPSEAADVVLIRSIVEKPAPEDAPSTYATIGRYVFTPAILDALDRIEPGVGGELQLTDAIDLLAHKEPVYGVVHREGRWDVGNKLGMMRATLELALARDDLRVEVRALLADIVGRHGIS